MAYNVFRDDALLPVPRSRHRGIGRCQPKVEMSPFCSSDFSLLREEKTCCLSCGVVGERRASVGSRWATRGGNARSMASRPSALSTGCPHAPKGARRSAGLVHKSTARPPALAASSSGRRARGGLERSPPGMVRRRLVGRPRPLLRLRRVRRPPGGLIERRGDDLQQFERSRIVGCPEVAVPRSRDNRQSTNRTPRANNRAERLVSGGRGGPDVLRVSRRLCYGPCDRPRFNGTGSTRR